VLLVRFARLRDDEGFTIVELLVGIVVVALLMGVIASALMSSTDERDRELLDVLVDVVSMKLPVLLAGVQERPSSSADRPPPRRCAPACFPPTTMSMSFGATP